MNIHEGLTELVPGVYLDDNLFRQIPADALTKYRTVLDVFDALSGAIKREVAVSDELKEQMEALVERADIRLGHEIRELVQRSKGGGR